MVTLNADHLKEAQGCLPPLEFRSECFWSTLKHGDFPSFHVLLPLAQISVGTNFDRLLLCLLFTFASKEIWHSYVMTLAACCAKSATGEGSLIGFLLSFLLM